MTEAVTIFTQEKSTWCAIKTESVYLGGSLYTVKQNSQNQLLQYTPHPPAIIIVSPWMDLADSMGATSYALGSGGFNLGFEM